MMGARPATALAAGERRVLHAHVRPAVPEGAWPLRQAMEDALRCASFDDAGRLVLVRRLRLAALPPGAGGVVFARALEQAWREATRQAVPALGPGDAAHAQEALAAPAVWFASQADAALAALVRVVEEVPLAGWFWPMALPVLRPAEQGTGRVRPLVALLHALAPTAWPLAVARWPPARRARLQEGLQEAVAAPLAERRFAAEAHSQRGMLQASEARSIHEPQGQHAAAVNGEHEAATAPRQVPNTVLPMFPRPAATIPSHAEPAHVSTPSQTAVIAADLPVASRPLPAAGASMPDAMPAPVAPSGVPATETQKIAVVPGSPPAAAAQRAAPPVPAEDRPSPSPRSTAAARVVPRAELPWLQDAACSTHAGALWLVNLLDAVGFGAANPSLAEVAAVLGGLFRTAGMPGHDPHWALLQQDDVPTPSCDPAARRWQWHARRALRRHAGLSVAALAQRPGRVTVTLTHADVVLPMEAVDLRIRRFGLDTDPGYVPWLGRIVAFRFTDRGGPRDG